MDRLCINSNNLSKIDKRITYSSSLINDAQSRAGTSGLPISGEIQMTQHEYDQLLNKYDEIENLTCPICFDRISLGQTVIRTLCSGTVDEKKKSDVQQYFGDKQDMCSDIAPDDGVILSINDLLKGHKFHKGCF